MRRHNSSKTVREAFLRGLFIKSLFGKFICCDYTIMQLPAAGEASVIEKDVKQFGTNMKQYWTHPHFKRYNRRIGKGCS